MINSIQYLGPFCIKKLLWLSFFSSFLFASCKKEEVITQSPLKKDLPIANAGRDTIAAFSTKSLSLDGSASSDPDGSITKYVWSKLSGPGSATIVTNISPAKVLVQNLAAGSYVFRLTVTDNDGLSATDSVIVFIPTKGQEFVFDNLTWRYTNLSSDSISDELSVHSLAKPELFFNASPLQYNPYFKADVFLKFESSSSWVQIDAAYSPNSKNPVNPYTYVVSAPFIYINSYPFDYGLIGKKVSIKIQFN